MNENISKSQPFAAAVAYACGIDRVRSASVHAEPEAVLICRVEFIMSREPLDRMGQYLSGADIQALRDELGFTPRKKS